MEDNVEGWRLGDTSCRRQQLQGVSTTLVADMPTKGINANIVRRAVRTCPWAAVYRDGAHTRLKHFFELALGLS